MLMEQFLSLVAQTLLQGYDETIFPQILDCAIIICLDFVLIFFSKESFVKDDLHVLFISWFDSISSKCFDHYVTFVTTTIQCQVKYLIIYAC